MKTEGNGLTKEANLRVCLVVEGMELAKCCLTAKLYSQGCPSSSAINRNSRSEKENSNSHTNRITSREASQVLMTSNVLVHPLWESLSNHKSRPAGSYAMKIKSQTLAERTSQKRGDKDKTKLQETMRHYVNMDIIRKKNS